MLIECTIERDGPTIINDGGFTFKFIENEEGHRVANVLSESTVTRLLAFPWFQKYEPEKKKAAAQAKAEPAAPQPAESEKEQLDQQIITLRKEGRTTRDIGSIVGRSATYVSKVCKAAM